MELRTPMATAATSLLASTERPLGLRRASPPDVDGARGPDGPVHLVVAVPFQQRPQWCWAAVAVGVAAYYDPTTPWTQCRVAREVLGADCCAAPDCVECDRQWYLDEALALVRHGAGHGRGALSLTAVLRELRRGDPIGVRIDWGDGSGHFVLLCGGDPRNGEVVVEDPARGRLTMHLDKLAEGYNDRGVWAHHYFLRG